MAVSPSRGAGGAVIAGLARGAPPARAEAELTVLGGMRDPDAGIVTVADGQHRAAVRTGPGVKLEAAVMSCRSFCVGGTFPHALVEIHGGRELIRGGPISTWAISWVNAPAPKDS